MQPLAERPLRRGIHRRPPLTALLGLTVALVLGSVSYAIDFDWNGSTDNDWLNGANWTPVGPPSGGDGNFARFYIGVTRAATISTDTPVVQDILSANDGSVGTRQINQTAGTVNLNGWMRLGVDPDGAGAITGAGDAGSYNMTGGTINAGSYRIGEVARSTATVTLSGNSVFNQRDVANPLDGGVWTRIGENGNAVFNVSGNATATFDSRLMIGAGPTSTTIVTQTGGLVETRRGQIVIGDLGVDVTYNISAGTLRTIAPGIDPTNPTNINQADIQVGQWDGTNAKLNVSGTAAVMIAHDLGIGVGRSVASAKGTVTQSGADSVVQIGGRLFMGDTNPDGGGTARSSGTYNLSNGLLRQLDVANPGDGGSWNFIGNNADANFNISGGIASFDARTIMGGAGSNSTVTQTGGTFEVRRGEFVIADTGGTDAQPTTYSISAGTLRTLAPGPDDDQGGNITIGQWDNSRGLLKASGTATVRAARDIQIAVGENVGNPTGTLTISDDATVTFGRRFISGRQIDGGNMGGDNGGIVNFSLGGNGIFKQDDVLDLDAETNWNIFASNATSVANVAVTGGTMSFDARTFFSRNGSGTYNQSGGIVEVRRGELDIAEGGSATYNLSGGTLRVLNGAPLVVGRWQNGVGQLNVSGNGQVGASGDLILGQGDDVTQTPLATGTLTQTGGRVTVGGNLQLATATQATGTYNLQGGVLDLTNGSVTKGAGTASFNITGGTLLDAGIINVPLNQQGGILAPGALNSAGRTTINGNYSLQSAGTIELSIISPALSDLIDVKGAVTLAGGKLTVTDDTPGLAIGSVFIILSNDGTDPITGTFMGLPEGQDFRSTAGNIFDISYTAGDGNDIRLLVVVPEPASAALFIGGSGILAFFRRRRS